MNEQSYLRQRAAAEARRVELATVAKARSVHEALRRAYLLRADAIAAASPTDG